MMRPNKTFKTIRLILGDQLNRSHSWFNKTNDDVLYVLMEVKTESEYVTHHVQKILGIFSAMRHFASELTAHGHQVAYFKIDDAQNQQDFAKNLRYLIERHKPQKFEYQDPDEYRLEEYFQKLETELKREFKVEVNAIDSQHFLVPRDFLASHFKGKKTYLMESIYRALRKKFGILMEGEDPSGGQWNYDKSNRKKIPKNHPLPTPKLFVNDVTEIYQEIKQADLPHFGEVEEQNFYWPLNREQALELFQYFLENLLPRFGDYQDTLTTESWSLYHSRISFALNLKILSPLELIKETETYWRAHQEEVDISQCEGFIRQILGWREYMRGVYWARMPEFATLNFFKAKRKLPEFFWTGKTQMKCLEHSIKQSLQYAYAHHIQRLMVTGNFCALAGIDPDEVDQWYLGIYIDAFHWVEVTNTRGMSQFADGGIIGSKPYVSSASYLHKMGHYCDQCRYDYKEKLGERACPLNSMYWHFLVRNRDKLENNPRMSVMYRTWEKMKDKEEILSQAKHYLENIESL
ncbi:MAG: cryptochrome/photolyase family protein [Luteibaculum sp.]